jgi:hypothetical protein
VVPQECTPCLCSLFRARWSRRHIPPDRSRRDSDAELHEQLGGHPLLAPCPIRGCHHRNELLQVRWNRRPVSRARFAPPEQLEPVSMPSNERLRLDDGQQTPLVEEPRQCDEADNNSETRSVATSRIVRKRLPRDSVMTRQILRRTTCQPPRIPRYRLVSSRTGTVGRTEYLRRTASGVAGTRVRLRCRQDHRADRRKHLTVVA